MRSRNSASSHASFAFPFAGYPARGSGRRSRPGQSGVSNTETLVIAGLIVAIIISGMIIFRGALTTATASLGRCIAGAVSGDFSGCRGGGEAPARATASPNKLPGVREGGLASGLVAVEGAPTGPGGVGGKPNTGGVGGKPGAGGVGGKPGGPAGPKGSAGAADLASAKQMLANFSRRINRTPREPETAAETFSRWWNQTSIFGANRQLAASQQELEDQADRAGRMTNQWLHTARQRLEAGDLAGFNEAMRNAQRYNNLQNTIEGRAASVLADNADQGMTEAANIRQVSFQTAAAIANPTGFVTGQVTGYVVSTAADRVLPDGRVKQVVVAVTTAAATAYAGGMTPGAWQNLGAVTATSGQVAGTFVNVADQVSSVVTTQQIHGNEEAVWEVITAVGTHAVMNTKTTRLAGDDGQPRSLNDYLSQAPSAQRVRNQLEDKIVPIGQLDANFQNVANHLKNEYAIATGAEANHAVTFKPLPPDPAYIQAIKKVQSEMKPLSDAEYAAAAKMGQTREMVDLKRAHAMVTGETMFDRETNLKGIQKIQDGEARGKSIYEHQKSGGEDTPFLPMDSNKAKPGQQLARAKAELAAATTPEARAKAQAAVKAAEDFVNQNNTWRDEAIANGHTKAVPNPDKPGKGNEIAGDAKTGKPLVADADSVTSNAGRPGENVHNMGAHGMTTTSESQSLSNLQHTLGQKGLETAQNHGHGARNPSKKNPEQLPNSVLQYTPDGKVVVVTGKDKILNNIRNCGAPEHPDWASQAGLPPRDQVPPPPNPKPTAGQIQLANNRNTIRTGYVQQAQIGTRNVSHKDDKNDPRKMRWPWGRLDLPPQGAPPASDVLAWLRPGSPLRFVEDRAGIRLAAAALQPPPRRLEPMDMQDDFDADTARKQLYSSASSQFAKAWGPVTTKSGLEAYKKMRGLATGEYVEKEALDRYLRWAFGLAGDAKDEVGTPLDNQTSVFERIDALAAPAWRADFDATFLGLHFGLAQYYTEKALALAGKQAYPAFAAQTAIARMLAAALGEVPLRQAYFGGQMGDLYVRMGTLARATPADAWAHGLAVLKQIDEAASREDAAAVQTYLDSLAGRVAPARPATGSRPLTLLWWGPAVRH